MLPRILLILILLGGSLFHSTARANAESAAIIAKLDGLLAENPLPPVHEVIPGYVHAGTPPPGIIVGVFTGDSDDDLDWGVTVSEILRQRISHAPRTLMQVPWPFWDALAHDALTSEQPDHEILNDVESLQTVGARLGIRKGLLGRVSVGEEGFEIRLRWLNLSSGETEARHNFGGSLEEFPRAIADMSLLVFERLGVPLRADEAEYLATPPRVDAGQLREYARLMTYWSDSRTAEAAEIAAALYESAPAFVSGADAHLHLAHVGEDSRVVNAFVHEVAGRHPDNVGIQLAAIRRWQSPDTETLCALRHWSQTLVADDPNSLMAISGLADILAKSGLKREATSVAREALRRWPDNYHAWWVFSNALRHLVWKDRWRKTPEEAAESGVTTADPVLSLASEAADEAIALHPYSSLLWLAKLEAAGGYSDSMMDAFENAIRYDPHNSRSYYAAMVYSATEWGGSREAQEYVYHVAVRNNPGEDWPGDMLAYVTGENPPNAGAGAEEPSDPPQEAAQPRDYLLDALERAGCDDACRQDLERQAKWIGLAVLVAIVVFVLRARSEETLSPPGSTDQYRPDTRRR